jgi:hypothetical protein
MSAALTTHLALPLCPPPGLPLSSAPPPGSISSRGLPPPPGRSLPGALSSPGLLLPRSCLLFGFLAPLGKNAASFSLNGSLASSLLTVSFLRGHLLSSRNSWGAHASPGPLADTVGASGVSCLWPSLMLALCLPPPSTVLFPGNPCHPGLSGPLCWHVNGQSSSPEPRCPLCCCPVRTPSPPALFFLSGSFRSHCCLSCGPIWGRAPSLSFS